MLVSRSSTRLVALAAAAVMLVGACSGGGASTAPSAVPASQAATAAPTAAGGGNATTLQAQLYQKFTSFDPWSESGTGGDTIAMSFQWDSLAIYDETGAVQYRVADSITGNSDATEWTIKLKSGIKWSDGTAFSTDDVLFSWQLNANPNQSANSNLWSGVVGYDDWVKAGDFSKPLPGMTAPDASTIVFKLKAPDGAFLNSLLNFRNYLLPKAAITAAAPNVFTLKQKDMWALPFWQAPTVALGPFKWTKTETDQFIQFAKNATYYGGTPPFDTVILKPISDFAISAAQLQSGDLDFAQVTINDQETLAANYTTGAAAAPFPIQSDYNTSSTDSQMTDVRVRQAFMYGCDRQGFVDTFLKGKGQKIDTYYFPAWVPKDGIKVYNFDSKKAKELLDAAKADGKFDYNKPVIWMSWNKDARDRQSFLEACQSQMSQIGVKVTIVNGLEVTDKAGKEGKWDLNLYGGYPVFDPNALNVPLACNSIGKEKQPNGYVWGGSNVVNWCSKEWDDLQAQGRAISDQAQRGAIYAKAQTIFLEQVPIQISYINANAFAWVKNLTGVTVFGDPSQWGWDIMKWKKSQ